MNSSVYERLIGIVSPILILAVWQALCSAGLVSRRYVPSPYDIFVAGYAMLVSGELLTHIGVSLYRLAAGFVIGAVPGILIGIAMGLNRYLRAALDPLVAALYPIPKIAVLPLLMMVFGLGDGSKIAAVAISVLLLTIINTLAGVRSIESIHFDVARNFNTPWYKLFIRVIVPATLPTVFAGLRIALGLSLVVLVGAEFVASRAGIGYLIWTSWETLLVDRMFVGIIVITALGVLSSWLLHELEIHFVPWRRR